MKKSKITAIVIILLLVAVTAFALPKGKDRHKKGGEIVRQYRTLEMLKVLDLSEEESEDVLLILKDVEKNRETFHFESNQIVNEIEFAIEQENTKELKELNDKLIELNKEFGEEKEKLHNKLRSSLSEEQFARFIIFKRSFGERLRRKIGKMKEERWGE